MKRKRLTGVLFLGAGLVAGGALYATQPADNQPDAPPLAIVSPNGAILPPKQPTADHTKFEQLKKEFKTGPEVTTACLECHTEASKQIMATSHWTWLCPCDEDSGEPPHGKADKIINNFCIALPSNEPRCTSCHIGYGWKDKSFDFNNETLVDCLVCHDTTGTYKKFPTAAGNPVYESTPQAKREWPPKSGKFWEPVDLANVAQHVGAPTRQNCGACHFFGGGGEGVKHGDMDVTLTHPHLSVDVHMSEQGADFQCTECHKTRNHKVSGRCFDVPAYVDRQYVMRGIETNLLACEACHGTTPHPYTNPAYKANGQKHDKLTWADKSRNRKLNEHADKVSCQACHIPTMAREKATKVWWDWSKAGKMNDKGKPYGEKKDPTGELSYHTKKGEFIWAKDAVPEYVWFNDKMKYTLYEDKIDDQTPLKNRTDLPDKWGSLNRHDLHKLDPDKPVALLNRSMTTGYDDPLARIWPAKIMRGTQPYDPVNKTMIVPKLFPGPGPDKAEAYWKSFDWARSVKAGMAYNDLPYSGKFGFIQTEMIWPLKHMVAPASDALTCVECHSPKGRLANLTGFYMPGRDHSKLIDWVGILIIIGGIAFGVVHGLLRILFSAKG